MRQWFTQRVHFDIESDHASHSPTLPANPRTFGNLAKWDEFTVEACKLLGTLDNTDLRYSPLVFHPVDPQDCPDVMQNINTIMALADVTEVRGVLFYVLRQLSVLAGVLGYKVAYTGGRSLSFSDMLVKITHRSSLSHLCSLIVAVISVIEQRQLALPHDMHLVDALQDPRYMDRVTQVVQQAYGHAVMNECPFAAITTGKVTHFLRRSLTDPTDSTVWVSPPVSFEGEAVPPLAAWLHLLNLAQSHALQPDGTKRPGWPRERVPVPTQNGYKLVLGGRAVKVGK
eukprot:GHUV01020946.1.p1 GENE.GHUV01020946.1~~GHUV01020946.1.p1  ORF type:complete len:285 (+),score=50.12 GHUV01020946.1:636-1490(+)